MHLKKILVDLPEDNINFRKVYMKIPESLYNLFPLHIYDVFARNYIA